jgi:hypothetical protein
MMGSIVGLRGASSNLGAESSNSGRIIECNFGVGTIGLKGRIIEFEQQMKGFELPVRDSLNSTRG